MWLTPQINYHFVENVAKRPSVRCSVECVTRFNAFRYTLRLMMAEWCRKKQLWRGRERQSATWDALSKNRNVIANVTFSVKRKKQRKCVLTISGNLLKWNFSGTSDTVWGLYHKMQFFCKALNLRSWYCPESHSDVVQPFFVFYTELALKNSWF